MKLSPQTSVRGASLQVRINKIGGFAVVLSKTLSFLKITYLDIASKKVRLVSLLTQLHLKEYKSILLY